MELSAPEFTAALAKRGFTPGIDLRLRYGRTRGLVDIAADIGFYNERGYRNFREIESAFGISSEEYKKLSYRCQTHAMFDAQLRELEAGITPAFGPQKSEFFTDWYAAAEKVGIDMSHIRVVRERHLY